MVANIAGNLLHHVSVKGGEHQNAVQQGEKGFYKCKMFLSKWSYMSVSNPINSLCKCLIQTQLDAYYSGLDYKRGGGGTTYLWIMSKLLEFLKMREGLFWGHYWITIKCNWKKFPPKNRKMSHPTIKDRTILLDTIPTEKPTLKGLLLIIVYI